MCLAGLAQLVREATVKLTPMAEHPKDGTAVLARLRPDLAEYTGLERVKNTAGLWVVVRNPGLADDGFDFGWNLAGPFGVGGWPDDWFVGYVNLPE